MSTFFSDLRHAFRTLSKSPGFTVAATLTLALGIGANAAIFSVVDAVLLRSLPYDQPERLVRFVASVPSKGMVDPGLSYVWFDQVRGQSKSIAGMAAYTFNESFNYVDGDRPEQLRGVRVSHEFFDVLGVHPLLGRAFREEEDRPGGENTVLLSEQFWRKRFSGDPNIVGRALTLGSSIYRVIGIVPAYVEFPNLNTDIWATKVFEYSGFTEEQVRGGGGYLGVIARLSPGARIQQAEAEARVATRSYQRNHPKNTDAGAETVMRLVPLQEYLGSGLRTGLLVLSGGVGLVLLIACVNIASLLLARATARHKEIAIRSALGASRARLTMQLLAESALLAAAGGALGILLAQWAIAALSVVASGTLGTAGLELDTRVLVFALAVSMLTPILFGLMPALQVSRPDVNDVLRDAAWGTSGGRHRIRARGLLVAGQVALSLVLLTGAGLLMRSFLAARSVWPGFDTRNILTMRIGLPPSKYAEPFQKTEFYEAVESKIASIPGLISSSLAFSLPPNSGLYAPLQIDGQPPLPLAERPVSSWQPIGAKYFETLRIPLLQGRALSAADNASAPLVAMVNQTFARRFWPDQNPIGKHFYLPRMTVPTEIVGVVGDAKNRTLESPVFPEIYTPYAQRPWASMYLVARAAGNPNSLASAIRSRIAEVDRELPVTAVLTMDEVMSASLSQRRLNAFLLAAFAAAALALASLGIYGVISYSVAQRQREIGIRRALGADRADIFGMIVSHALRLTLIGMCVGLPAAFASTRLLSTLLYATKPADPITFGVICLLFPMVALVASLIPASRAMRVDAQTALRD